MKQHLRILASMIFAFFVVILYGRLSTSPLISPAQADNIKGLLANLKFPKVNLTKLFTLRFNPTDNGTIDQPNNGNSSFNLPTAKPVPTNFNQFQPTPSPTGTNFNQFLPTPTNFNQNKPTPTIFSQTFPTYTPKPTKPPKPTATPKPPPITTDIRPGNSLTEIFKEVNKRACFPVALLYAFKTVETGERFKNDSSSTIKTYNTYGWWKTGAGDPCYGYGYHTQTGIVPEDSVNAGISCNSAIGDPTDLKIMGILQISEWEQEVAQKYISSTLPKTNDRRVLFDNALIFAHIERSRVGDPPKDCNSWPDDMVRLAAEKHLGSGCEYYYSQNGASGNYCNEILTKYKEYKKQGF